MIDPGRIREVTREVLDRRAYDDLDPTLGSELLERARAAVAQLVDTILGTGVAGGVGQLIAITLVVVLLVGGLLLVIGLRRGGRDRAVPETPAGADAVSLQSEAMAARARGDLAQAVRSRYGALVLTLVEEGVLTGRPGLTVGEVDAAVAAGLPEAAAPTAEAGRVLADVVYGDVSPDGLRDDVVADGLAAVARATGRRDLVLAQRIEVAR